MSSSVQAGGGVGNTHAHKFSFSSLLSYTETRWQLPRSILCRIFHLSPADFPVTRGKDSGLPPSAHCRHDTSLAAILASCKMKNKQTNKHLVPCIFPVVMLKKQTSAYVWRSANSSSQTWISGYVCVYGITFAANREDFKLTLCIKKLMS